VVARPESRWGTRKTRPCQKILLPRNFSELTVSVVFNGFYVTHGILTASAVPSAKGLPALRKVLLWHFLKIQSPSGDSV
jgi:hypothetical protein